MTAAALLAYALKCALAAAIPYGTYKAGQALGIEPKRHKNRRKDEKREEREKRT